jgi:RNA polymerase sigma-70 factor (ECF subfamily)
MDCELVDRARSGDREAFAEIVETTFDRSFEIARRILGESYLAQDATQQAMLSIWRDLPKLRDVARYDAWARRILVHACYAESAKARRTIPGLADTLPQAPVIADVASAVIDRDLLERTFAHIKVEQRTILVLRYYLDQTQEEIAATLDLPVGTVKSRIHHALRAMRAAIESESRPPGGSSASGELTDQLTQHRTGQVAR